jgi:hypothetical protein
MGREWGGDMKMLIISDWLALIDDFGWREAALQWQATHPTWMRLWQVEDCWQHLQNWSA